MLVRKKYFRCNKVNNFVRYYMINKFLKSILYDTAFHSVTTETCHSLNENIGSDFSCLLGLPCITVQARHILLGALIHELVCLFFQSLLWLKRGASDTVTRRSHNVVLMLGKCRRRWTNIKLTLGQRLVSTGLALQRSNITEI